MWNKSSQKPSTEAGGGCRAGSGHSFVSDYQAEGRLIEMHKGDLFVKYKYLMNETAEGVHSHHRGSSGSPHAGDYALMYRFKI